MGQYLSSSQSNSAQNTPQRVPNCVDPRSPTRDIDRTPIQINDNSTDENSFTAPKTESKRQSLRQKIYKKKAEEAAASASGAN